MAVDMKSAASVVPKLISQSLAASDTLVYTCPAGVTATIRKIRLTNVDGSPRNVTLSLVRAADPSGVTNRLMAGESLAAAGATGYRVDLGGGDVLNEGDFISGFAPSSTNVDVLISLIEFGAAPGGALSGIHVDSAGSGGYSSGTGVVTGTNAVGTAANRRMYAALLATVQTGASSSSGYAAYDTFTATCAGLSMTRKLVSDIKSSTTLLGSISIWEYIDPGSGTTPTIQANVVKSGYAFNLVLATISMYGIASTGATAIDAPTSAAALNCSVASATGRRVLFAGGFTDPPNSFTLGGLNTGSFNGNPNPTNTRPHWLILAQALGAATVAAADTSSDVHGGLLLELLPA